MRFITVCFHSGLCIRDSRSNPSLEQEAVGSSGGLWLQTCVSLTSGLEELLNPTGAQGGSACLSGRLPLGFFVCYDPLFPWGMLFRHLLNSITNHCRASPQDLTHLC